MTPAIKVLKKHKVSYQLAEYEHSPDNHNFGEEVCEKLGQSPEVVFKTLLIVLNGDPKHLAVCILPVAHQLNLKKAAQAFKAKKAQMCPKDIAEKSTGYIVGGISPLGQKKQLPTVIDQSALNLETIFVSGGKRGLQVALNPQDIVALTRGSFADLVD